MKYHKLVRDNIPEILETKNIPAIFHTASGEEFKQQLHAKLLEEVNEFNENPSLEEMADVMEVVLTLQEYYKMSNLQIETARKEKVIKRGAFKKRIILEETQE